MPLAVCLQGMGARGSKGVAVRRVRDRKHRDTSITTADQDEQGQESPGGISARGLIPFDPQTRDALRAQSWRKPRPQPWRLWPSVLAVILLHAVFVVVVWHEMRPRPLPAEVVHLRLDQALRVELVMRPPPPPAAANPPPPAAPPPVPPPRPHPHEAPAKDALVVTPPPPSSPPPSQPQAQAQAPLKLFDHNGMIVLPSAPTSASTAGYVQGAPQGDTQIMQNRAPVVVQTTRFDQDWGKGGGPVTRALNKAVEKTTVTHTFHPLPGVRIHCAVTLAALAGGCGGDPPSPPSAKDGDQRLNMAPATALAKDPHPAAPPPSVESCIADYRDGKPLAYGCPTDTPTRAVDDELRECIALYLAGKHLPARCPADTPQRAERASSPPPTKP